MLSGVRVALRGELAGYAADWLAGLGAEVGDMPLDTADALIVSGADAFHAAALLATQPRLIVAAITPFGLDGPRAHWRTCDTVAQALGGMLWLNGHAHEPPLRGLGAQAYQCAGLQAALGIGLALLARQRSGAGQIVDVSIHESVVASLEHATGRYRQDGTIAARQGTLHWSGAFRVGQCRDGPVLLSHLGDWTALREWLQADGAAADLLAPRWADEALRRANAAHVFDVLDAWARRYTTAALLERAALLRLPFAPVLPLQQAGSPSTWVRVEPAASPSRPGSAATVAPRSAAGGVPARPLDGVTVLDFTWVVAGPLATRVLADFGAEVIKVERLEAPDGAARRGGLFGNLNRGKRSLGLDMNAADDRAIARSLAARADVVVDNFSPRVMANWGLDAAAIHAVNPRAIVAGLSAFGRADGRVGYGPTLQAMSGFTWHMRHADGAPAGLGFAYADVASGYAAALAIVAALWRRGVDGRGGGLDVAQCGVVEQLLARQRGLADAVGNASPEGQPAPHGIYPCGEDEKRAQVHRCGGAEVELSTPNASVAALHASAPPQLRTSARISPSSESAIVSAALPTSAPPAVCTSTRLAPSSDRWIAIAVFDDADWQRLAAVI
ncbi:MAG: CoA transferase, partial [bacterium]